MKGGLYGGGCKEGSEWARTREKRIDIPCIILLFWKKKIQNKSSTTQHTLNWSKKKNNKQAEGTSEEAEKNGVGKKTKTHRHRKRSAQLKRTNRKSTPSYFKCILYFIAFSFALIRFLHPSLYDLFPLCMWTRNGHGKLRERERDGERAPNV